jgi:cytochrome P450
MNIAAKDLKHDARERAYSMPLEEINVADPELFRTDTMWPYFERLRKEDPVHYCAEHEFGPYWSVTKYNDIMAVDTNHADFSSEPSITIVDPKEDFTLPMFIAMDPPKHDAQRKVVSPVVAPGNLEYLAPIIRERAGKILDSLPIGEEFDWVDKVSIELTTMTLATLFDFPWEDRRKLTYWSDMATASKVSPLFVSDEHRREVLFECADYFMKLWNERVNAEP